MFKNVKSIAEKAVGKTRFLFVKINKSTQVINTKTLTNKSDPDSTPAGNTIILAKSAAKVP